MPENAAKLPIDVIIPVWGEAYSRNLPRALASVSAAADRTIVGDEHSMEIGLSAGATRTVPLKTKHPGPARGQGLASSTQPFVLFMDSDDRLFPGSLEKLYALLVDDKRSVAAAGYFKRSSDGGYWPTPKQAKLAVSPLGRYALLFRNMLPAHGSILMRREALLNIRGPLFTTVMDEDWHTGMKLRVRGRVRFLHEPIYDYTVEEGSMSRMPRGLEKIQASHNALLASAEESLGRISPSMRLVEHFARPYRLKRDTRNQAYYAAQAAPAAVSDVTYGD